MAKRLLALTMMVLAGCGSHKQHTPQEDYKAPNLPPSLFPPPVGAPAPAHGDATPKKPLPGSVIPANAQFTVYAGRVEGDAHVLRADRLKSQLIDVTHMRDWYVVHEADKSILYYGYYRSINDDKDSDTKRAQFDRAKISMMTDPMGDRPFREATLVPLAAADPIAKPEWNLVNAPGDCTLEIAVYKGSTGRKQAAVDAVTAARAQGIEAYYYHGPNESLVCVGHWPASAYRQEGAEVKTQNPDPDQMVMSVPDLNDPKYKQHLEELKQQQQNLQVVQNRTEILDPTLREMMMKFPRNSLNGMEHKHLVKGQEVYDASQLVPIPHDKPAETAAAAPSDTGGYDPNYRPNIPSDRPLVITPAPAPAGGHLRALGE